MSRKEEEQELLGKYLCPETDSFGTTGVLLSDEIEQYVQQFRLIDPFDPKNLKAAGYELTIGHRCAIGGNFRDLVDETGKNEVTIPAFQVLIIQTRERVNLPRFLIGRWNIKVGLAYRGLLWVGGPQVDPGYVGYLSCPIYNLSDKEVTLKLGEPIALIDFVKTTPFKTGFSQPYQRPPKRVLFEDYDPEKLKSALFTQAGQKLEKIEDQFSQFEAEVRKNIDHVEDKLERSLDALHTRVNSVTAIIFTAIAILVGSLSILVSTLREVETTVPYWLHGTITLSIVAIVLSVVAFSRSRVRRLSSSPDMADEIKKLERSNNTLAVGLIVAILLNIFIIWKIFVT